MKKKKTSIVESDGFRWKTIRGKIPKQGNFITSVKIAKIRHKNVDKNTMVSQH